MNKDLFNSYNLMAFKEIIEKGSFTAAAKKLNCSQGQLSSIVMSMEDYCGVQLIQRNNKGSTLTQHGQDFLSALNAYLVSRDAFIYEVSRFDKNDINERVTIYAPPGSIYYMSHSLLPSIYARHREIPVTMHKLHAGDTDNYDSILEKTDILISFVPSKIPLAINRKFKLEMGFYISPSLFNKIEILSPKDLLNAPCITIENYGHQSHSWVYKNEQGDDIQLDIIGKYSCHDITSAIPLAVGGLGVILIPVVAAEHHVKNGELVQLFPSLSTQIKNYYVIYTNLTKKKRNTSFILKALIAHASDLESKITSKYIE